MVTILISGLIGVTATQVLQPAQGYRLYQPTVTSQHQVFNQKHDGSKLTVFNHKSCTRVPFKDGLRCADIKENRSVKFCMRDGKIVLGCHLQ